MKYIKLVFCTILFVLVFSNANVYADEIVKIDTTTIYLVRHTEKELNGDKNPKLTDQGIQRAEFWAKVLSGTEIDAVYSTDTIRTRDTAKPTANSKDKEVTIYDARGIDYSEFLKSNLNKTVFVVGHSNTIPSFVNALIGEERYKNLDENNYSSLFIVDIVGNDRRSKLLTINPFSY